MSALTPEDIEKQIFREKFKGYDQEEVDAFLDRVSDRLGELLRERQGMLQRVEEVERDAAESVEAERLLKRTLITAQRTADETVAEAVAQATGTIADADERAAQIVNDANERSARLIAEAQEQAVQMLNEAERRAADLVGEARRQAQEQQDAADRELQRVRRAVAELQRFRNDYRDRVRAVVAEQLAIIDRAGDIPEVPPEIVQLADAPPVDRSSDAPPSDRTSEAPASGRTSDAPRVDLTPDAPRVDLTPDAPPSEGTPAGAEPTNDTELIGSRDDFPGHRQDPDR